MFMAVSMMPKYVIFELLLHAAFVADEIWGDVLEAARSWSSGRLAVLHTLAKLRLAHYDEHAPYFCVSCVTVAASTPWKQATDKTCPH